MVSSVKDQVPLNTSLAAALVALLCLILCSGCGTSIIVEGTLPTPLVKKLPLSMGVYYPPEFRKFTHQEKIFDQGTWTVDMGSQNLDFFRGMFVAMFDELQEIESLDIPPKDAVGIKTVSVPENLDGIIVPEIIKYGFLTPQISGLNFFSASIHYRIRIYDKAGNLAVNIFPVGYGKSPTSMFGDGKALSEATTLAIRDGGAKIATEAFRQPAVLQWLRANNISLD
jgi:hypothetical protein